MLSDLVFTFCRYGPPVLAPVLVRARLAWRGARGSCVVLRCWLRCYGPAELVLWRGAGSCCGFGRMLAVEAGVVAGGLEVAGFCGFEGGEVPKLREPSGGPVPLTQIFLKIIVIESRYKMLTKKEMEELVKPLEGCDAVVLAWHDKETNNVQQIIFGDVINMDILLASLINRIYEKTGCPADLQLEGLKEMLEQIKENETVSMDEYEN